MSFTPVHAGIPETPVSRDDSVQVQSGAAKWLAFQAPQQHYLFALEHIGQVLQAQVITRVPFTQHWFCGAINVRGVLHAVIDLAAFLALGDAQSNKSSYQHGSLADTGSAHLVTLSAALDWPCALVAGSLQGLRNPTNFLGASADDVVDHPLLAGLHRDPLNRRWMEVNLPALVASVRSHSIQAPQGNL